MYTFTVVTKNKIEHECEVEVLTGEAIIQAIVSLPSYFNMEHCHISNTELNELFRQAMFEEVVV